MTCPIGQRALGICGSTTMTTILTVKPEGENCHFLPGMEAWKVVSDKPEPEVIL